MTAKLTRVPTREQAPATLGPAAVLDQANLAVTSRRVYGASLAAFADGVGRDSALVDLDEAVVASWYDDHVPRPMVEPDGIPAHSGALCVLADKPEAAA